MLCGDPAVEVVTAVHDLAPEPEAVRSDTDVSPIPKRCGSRAQSLGTDRAVGCSRTIRTCACPMALAQTTAVQLCHELAPASWQSAVGVSWPGTNF